MSQPFDIFLVCAPKDYGKLKYCAQAIQRNIHGFSSIYVSTPARMSKQDIQDIGIHNVLDLHVLKCQPRRWKYRPNWVFQQMLKLFQNVTQKDWYFVCDVDTIINRPIPLWDGDRPVWYVGWEQNNARYYRFQDKMFGYGRVYDHTFLADMGHYNKKLVAEMLSTHGYTVDSFIRKTYEVIDKDCHPSEADVYMSYVHKYHPGYYDIRELKTVCMAKEGTLPMQQLWSEAEIQGHINRMKAQDVDTFALHSWIDKSHNSWQAA